MKHTEADEQRASDSFEINRTEESGMDWTHRYIYKNGYLAGLLEGRSEKQGEVVSSLIRASIIKPASGDFARVLSIDWGEREIIWDSPIELIESFAFQSMEASHLKELPEGFDSSISAEQYFIWCKHHQKAAELRLNESSEMKRKLVDMESKHREEIADLKSLAAGNYDEWFKSAMPLETYEMKRAHDIYYKYTKEVCIEREYKLHGKIKELELEVRAYKELLNKQTKQDE